MLDLETLKDFVRRGVEDGGIVTYPEIYEELEVPDDRKEWVRNTLSDMARRRLLERVYVGRYKAGPRLTEPQYRVVESFPRIWRGIDSSKPGWSITDICRKTMLSYACVRRHCMYLEENGYIRRHGRASDSRTRLYSATMKFHNQFEIPFPTKAARKDPYCREKQAATAITRLLREPTKTEPVRQKILEQIGVLLERFQGGGYHDQERTEHVDADTITAGAGGGCSGALGACGRQEHGAQERIDAFEHSYEAHA